ncbi:hypothetical protein FANTH_9012 [Fusarium anthophilum]|uniref:Aminoglycoside phosphotransferase domain-containing protein n=1 Tax=Fusarium anthophilum TaxID=48485 RepID=A0A8H4Z817_9HYPO|nr:hypothetical protein FANTH_9012 [Fusarium anthophilum]
MMFKSLVMESRAPRGNFNSERPLPLTPDEVISEALGAAVKHFKISSVIHGTSSKVFVDLVFGDGVETEIPSRFVLKGWFYPVIRETVPQMLPAYRREAEFYFHVAPQTTMLLPNIWFTGTDTVNGQGIFIMSDISSEATFRTPLEPWTPERVGEGLKQLASLHAKTWDTSEEKYPWLIGRDGEKLENPVRNVILALLEPAPWGSRFDEKVQPPVTKELLDPDRIRKAF